MTAERQLSDVLVRDSSFSNDLVDFLLGFAEYFGFVAAKLAWVGKPRFPIS
jgi:hypothetical protein